MQPDLAKTPLFENHVRAGARIVPFAGYEMPVQYSGVLEETKAVRTHAGLFDVSHMGQFSVHGANALAEVQKLVTNDLTKLGIGQAQYNLLCNPEGGIIDDLVVYRRKEDHIYICVNASNRKADYAWMKGHLGAGVLLEDESDDTALLALQGPNAEKLIAANADPQVVRALKYYWAVETTVFGKPCYLSRTGYTGEDGFELYVANEHASFFWDTILEKGQTLGVVPIGLGARDTLRIEMGYPLHGHEISTTISPLAANLNWVVKLARSTPFIGQDALKKEVERGGPERVLRAFIVEDRRIARQGYAIADATNRKIGEITSGTHSPHVGAPIALGFVEREAATAEKLFVEVRGAFLPARVVKLPFVPSRTKKNPK